MSEEVMSTTCDRCGKLPLPFMAGNSEGEDEVQCHWHVVSRESFLDPVVLMSNGELAFKLAPEIEHPVTPDEAHLCIDCFDELFSQDSDEEE